MFSALFHSASINSDKKSKGTPFVLEGSGTDADAGDVLTYCWEQYDENNASTTYPSTTATTGVAFRSFEPTTDNHRYFPVELSEEIEEMGVYYLPSRQAGIL